MRDLCLQVSVIKAKMFDELGMPAGKQKLQLDVRPCCCYALEEYYL